MGRHDWLYELRPVPIREKVVEELGRHLAGELATWPPPVEDWLSETERARFAPLYADPKRPASWVYRYAFHLVRLELAREYEAIDWEMRNEAWRAHVGTAGEMEAVHLLVRWLMDVLLAVKERTGQGLSREDLGKVVDEVERRVAGVADA